MKRAVLTGLVLMIGFSSRAAPADLTLIVGGKVSIELQSSDAAFHNTLLIDSPSVAVAITGCKLEPATGLPGTKILSEKIAMGGTESGSIFTRRRRPNGDEVVSVDRC